MDRSGNVQGGGPHSVPPPPLTKEEQEEGITDRNDPSRSCFHPPVSEQARHSSGRNVLRQREDGSQPSSRHLTSSRDFSSSHRAPIRSQVSVESIDSVASGYSDDETNDETEIKGSRLLDRDVGVLDDYDPTIAKVTDRGVDLKRREASKKVRSEIIKGIRKDKAELWMHDNGNKMLKCLDDRAFAEDEGFKVILVINGKDVQLAPPISGQGVDAETLFLYTKYVRSSVAGIQENLRPLNDLKEKIKESSKRLEKINKELTKQLGMRINVKAEKEWIQNTRIVLTLAGGSGWVDGEREQSTYIPEAALSRKQHSGLKPDALVVRADSDFMEELSDSLKNERLRYAGGLTDSQEGEWWDCEEGMSPQPLPDDKHYPFMNPYGRKPSNGHLSHGQGTEEDDGILPPGLPHSHPYIASPVEHQASDSDTYFIPKPQPHLFPVYQVPVSQSDTMSTDQDSDENESDDEKKKD